MYKGNRETLELFLILIIVILLVTTIFFMGKTIELMYYNENALVNTIMDKKWYSYNDYYYEMFEVSSDRSINYSYKDNLNNIGRFEKCNLILYTLNDNNFKMICNNETKKISISSLTENELVLLVDGNKIKYVQHFDK